MLDKEENKSSWALELGVVVGWAILAVMLRIAHIRSLANMSPVGALGLFGGSKLRSWYAFIAPIGVMIVSDICLSHWYQESPFHYEVYACFLLNALWGRLFLQTNSPWRIGGFAVVSSLQFFLITNFVYWTGIEGYPREFPMTLAGLGECYFRAIPFLWRTLVGDLVFTGLIFGSYAWALSVQKQRVSEPA